MAIIAYVWWLAREMPKFVCWEEVVLGRCDTMYVPSKVGRSEGEAMVYSSVMELVDVR